MDGFLPPLLERMSRAAALKTARTWGGIWSEGGGDGIEGAGDGRGRPRDGIGGGGCTQFVHGRSRMTIDARIPTMPGRSTSGFHQPGGHYLHQVRSAVRCSASRMKGEPHPSKNRS